LEFLKLVEVMETKGLKILRNIKTCWISMLARIVRVMNEYRTLLVKFQQDSSVRKPKKIAVKCFTKTPSHPSKLYSSLGWLNSKVPKPFFPFTLRLIDVDGF
jgi:hypothetical protein